MNKLANLFILVVLAVAPSPSWAATAALRAVQINDIRIQPTGTVTVQPGDVIVSEIVIWGWNEDRPGGRLRAAGATLANDYDNGDCGGVRPIGWPLDTLYTVVPCTPGPGTCPLEYECFPDGACYDRRELKENVFIEPRRSDAPFGSKAFCGADTRNTISFQCVALGSGVLDSGSPKYLGTVRLRASDDAFGRFTIRLSSVEYETFFELEALQPQFLEPQLVPLTVFITGHNDEPIGACSRHGSPCATTTAGDCSKIRGLWHETLSCCDDEALLSRSMRRHQRKR